MGKTSGIKLKKGVKEGQYLAESASNKDKKYIIFLDALNNLLDTGAESGGKVHQRGEKFG